MKKLIFLPLLFLFGCITNHNYYLESRELTKDGLRRYKEDGFIISANKYMNNELYVMIYVDSVKQFHKIEDLKLTIENDKNNFYEAKSYEAYCPFTEISAKNGYFSKTFKLLPEIAKQPRINTYYTCYTVSFNFEDIKSKYIIVHMDMDAITNTGELVKVKKDFRLYHKKIISPSL